MGVISAQRRAQLTKRSFQVWQLRQTLMWPLSAVELVGGHGAALHARAQQLETAVFAGGDVGGSE